MTSSRSFSVTDNIPLTNVQLSIPNKLGTVSCISLIVNKMIGTGIFSTPSIIFQLSGSVGVSLVLWLLGGIIIFCGLSVFLEFGLAIPISGGEKNYLQRCYKPKALISCVYAFQIVLLGFSSGNSFAFGKYILFTFGYKENVDFQAKLIGVMCITFAILLHSRYPNRGTALFNFLGLIKVLILILIISIGSLAFFDIIKLDEKPTNFRNIWEKYDPNSGNLYSVSVALLEIIYSFKGWENANYVLSEIHDPVKVLTIAAPLAVLTTSVLYFLVVISYLIVIPKIEFFNSGVLIAGIFFEKIFGESVASHILPVLISCSNLGNVLAVSFAHARVNQELAKENYLPFSNTFKDLNYSLWLHWFVTVLVLVLPPSNGIYEFVVNLYIYPGTWINLLVTGGLLYLHYNAKDEKWGKYSLDEDSAYESTSTFGTNYGSFLNPLKGDDQSEADQNDEEFPRMETHIPKITTKARKRYHSNNLSTLIFLLANIFLAIIPFVPPPKEYLIGNPSNMPYWLFPVTGSSVLVAGAIYWWFFKRS